MSDSYDWEFDELNEKWIMEVEGLIYDIFQRGVDCFYGSRTPTDELDPRMKISEGVLSKDGICCGYAMCSAIGPPPLSQFKTLREAKEICEKDFEHNFSTTEKIKWMMDNKEEEEKRIIERIKKAQGKIA